MSKLTDSLLLLQDNHDDIQISQNDDLYVSSEPKNLQSAAMQFNELRECIRMQKQLKEKLLHENALLRQQADQIMSKSQMAAATSKFTQNADSAVSANTVAQLPAFSLEVSRAAKSIAADLEDLKALLRQNSHAFQATIDGVARAVRDCHESSASMLSKTNSMAQRADERSQVERLTERPRTNVFPSQDAISALSCVFTPRMREILGNYVANDDVYVFLQDKILSYLECTLFELKENWTREVEQFVKEQALEHFCIEGKGLVGSRIQAADAKASYATDESDSLEVVWIMMKVFQLLAAEQHENVD